MSATDYLIAIRAAWRAHDALSNATRETYGAKHTAYLVACNRMHEAYAEATKDEAPATPPKG